MSEHMEALKGVVAVLVAEDGRAIANAVDFHTSCPGGFSQREAQEIRCRNALAMKAMRELSSPMLSNAITEYDAEKILRKMCDNGGRVHLIPVGYDK